MFGEQKLAEFNEFLLNHYAGRHEDLVKEEKLSKNMYDQIRSMKLGNLASLETIPDVYIKLLFKYAIGISEAFAHAHSHDVVHGAFDLSKVLLQKKAWFDLQDYQ